MRGFAVIGTIILTAMAPLGAQAPAAPGAPAQAKPAGPAPPSQTAPAPQTQAPAPAPVPPRPFPEGSKVAYVVLQRIANESADGKAATSRIQALQQKKAAELNDKNKQLQTAQQKLEKEASVLSQTHVFPKAYAELLLENTTSVRTVRKGDAYVVSYGDLQTFALSLDPYDPDQKIRDMDAAGIDVSVLTVNIPGPELLTRDLVAEGARICNDYLADLSARYRGRFVGLATLPLQDVAAAMAEYERSIHGLKLRGIFLFSHIAGKPLDAPEFDPLYAAAERDQVPLVLHPTVPTWGEVVKDYSMIPMIGLMMDTSIAMLRLILSGTLERHPTLLIVHPHCGGVLPYLMPRVEEQTDHRPSM